MADPGDVNHRIKIHADVDEAIAGINAFGGSLDILSVKIQNLGNLANDEFNRISDAINRAHGQINGQNTQTGQQQGGYQHEPYFGPSQTDPRDTAGNFTGGPGVPNVGHGNHQAPPPPPPPPTPGHERLDGASIGREIGQHLRQFLETSAPGSMGSMLGSGLGFAGAAFSNPVTASLTVLAAAAMPIPMAAGKNFQEYEQRHLQETQYAHRIGVPAQLMEQGAHYNDLAAEGFKPLEANALLEAARVNVISLQQLNESIDSAKALGMDTMQMVEMSGKAAFDMGYTDMRDFGADMRAEARQMGGMTANMTPEFMQQQLAIAATFANAFGERLEGEERQAVHTAQGLLQDDPYYRDNLPAQQRILQGLASGGSGVDPSSNFGMFTYLRHAGVSGADAVRGLTPEDKLKVMEFNEQELKRRFPDASPEQLDTVRATMQKRMEGVLGLSAREQETLRKQAEKKGWDRVQLPDGDEREIDEGKDDFDRSRVGRRRRADAELQDRTRGIGDRLGDMQTQHIEGLVRTWDETADDFRELGDLAKELMGPFKGMFEAIEGFVDKLKGVTDKLDAITEKLTNPKEAAKAAGDVRDWIENTGPKIEFPELPQMADVPHAGQSVVPLPRQGHSEAQEGGQNRSQGSTHATNVPAPVTDGGGTSGGGSWGDAWDGSGTVEPRHPATRSEQAQHEHEPDWSGSGSVDQRDWSGSGTVQQRSQQQATRHQTFNPQLQQKWSPRYAGILRSAAQKHGVPVRLLEKIKLQETGRKESNFRSGDGGMSHGGFQWYETVHPEVARRAKRDEQFGADKTAERLAWARRSVRQDVDKMGWQVSDAELEAMALTAHNAPAVADLESMNALRRRAGKKPIKSWQEWWEGAERLTAAGGHKSQTNPFGRKQRSYLNDIYTSINDDKDGMQSHTPVPHKDGASGGGTFELKPLARPTAGPITSRFGPRERPGGIGSKDHKGVDFGVPSGTPVKAPAGGTVEMAKELPGYGNYVLIDHGDGYKSGYAHLSDFDVKPGQQIKPGQVLGKSGGGADDPGRGTSTGAHLHWEVSKDGKFIDPLKAKLPRPVQAKPSHDHKRDGHEHHDMPRSDVPTPRPGARPGLGFIGSNDPNDLLGGLLGPIGSNVPGYDQVMRGGFEPQFPKVRTGDFNPDADEGKVSEIPTGIGAVGAILAGVLGMGQMANPSTDLEEKNAANRAMRETAENTREMRDMARTARTPGINPNAQGPQGALSGPEMLERLEGIQGRQNSALMNVLDKLAKGDLKGAGEEVAGELGKKADDVAGNIRERIDKHIPSWAKPHVNPWLDKAQEAGTDWVKDQLGNIIKPATDAATKAGGRIGSWASTQAANIGGWASANPLLAGGAGMAALFGGMFIGSTMHMAKNPYSPDLGNGVKFRSDGSPEQNLANLKHMEAMQRWGKGSKQEQEALEHLRQIQVGQKGSEPKAPTVPGAPYTTPSPTWGMVEKGRSHNDSEAAKVPSGGPPLGRTNFQDFGAVPERPQPPKVQSVNGQVRGMQSPGQAGNKYVNNVANNINVGGNGGYGGEPDEMARLVAAVRSGTYAAMQEQERRFSRQIDYN